MGPWRFTLNRGSAAAVLWRRFPSADCIDDCSGTAHDCPSNRSGTHGDDKAYDNTCMVVFAAITIGRNNPANDEAQNDPENGSGECLRHVDTPMIVGQLQGRDATQRQFQRLNPPDASRRTDRLTSGGGC